MLRATVGTHDIIDIGYSYDGLCRRITMTKPDSTTVEYSYDSASRLVSVTEGGAARGAWEYDPRGFVTKLTHGSGAYTEYAYDDVGRLTLVKNQTTVIPDTPASRFDYFYDDGNVVTKMDISGYVYTAASVAYQYDNAYQLTSAVETGGDAYSESWYYDSAGNRTKRTLNGTNTLYSYGLIEGANRGTHNLIVGATPQFQKRNNGRGLDWKQHRFAMRLSPSRRDIARHGWYIGVLARAHASLDPPPSRYLPDAVVYLASPPYR